MRVTHNNGDDFTKLVIDLFEMKITSEEFKNEMLKAEFNINKRTP